MLAVAIIAAATLWPLPSAPQPGEVFCLVCGPLGGVDFLSNIVLFAPLGIALAAAGTRVGAATGLAALLSVAIEAAQWRLIPGRDASAGDVLANTIGCLLGALLVCHARTLLRPSARRARGLAVGAALAVIGVLVGGAWALRPASPTTRYWSQWTPVRGGYQPFIGSVRRLTLFGRDIPNGMMIDPGSWPSEYSLGELAVTAVVAASSATAGPALIARAGNPLGEQFELAQHGNDLVARGRSNAARLGLRSPSFVLRGGLPTDVTPRSLQVDVVPGEVRLTSAGTRDTVRARYRVGVATVWQTVTPFVVTRFPLVTVIGVLWIAVLFVPVAYWSSLTRVALLLPIGSALVGVEVAPRLAGIAPAGRWELAGALLGVAMGGFLGRRVRSRAPEKPAGDGEAS